MPGHLLESEQRRRFSFSDELQWKLLEKNLRVGIRRHNGNYQVGRVPSHGLEKSGKVLE
jgi:hypothetical protein